MRRWGEVERLVRLGMLERLEMGRGRKVELGSRSSRRAGTPFERSTRPKERLERKNGARFWTMAQLRW
jgi:hypothetical protein